MEILRRAVLILEQLAHSEATELGVDQLSRATGLSPSTVHRFLSSLKELGFVQQNPDNSKYRLGYKVAELGVRFLERLDVRSLAVPLMVELRNVSGETVGLSIKIDAVSRAYVHEVEGVHQVRVRLPVAKPLPLYLGAPGRVLSAWLSPSEIEHIALAGARAELPSGVSFDPGRFRAELAEVRARGYAVANSEYMTGTSSVAVPVRDGRGNVVAALSISGPRVRFTEEAQEAVLPHLFRAAEELCAALGCVGLKSRSAGRENA
ncbi:MAG: IclR family transcriptional regulator [Synergistales bacterium]|nr:IclR family transcriptional regulator [Synergistales bacterium]